MNEILIPDADSVPGDWQMVELGTITDVKGGKRLPKGTEYSDHVTEHPYIRVTDFDSLSVRFSELKYISGDTHEQVARYTISKDDVYISIAGTIGLVGTIPDGLTGANLTENAAKIVIRNAEELLNRYLALWLSSSQGQAEIRLRTTKTSQPKLALMRIKQIPIPLPPLPEQRRIAAVLNAIQDAIAAQEDVIAAARQLKRSLMQRLFTVGPYREPAETKETEIGEIPRHWGVTPFVDFCVLQRGFDITKKQQLPGKVPVVSSGGVRSYHSESKVSGPGVVVGRKGSLGTVYYIESDYWPHDTTLWVKDFKDNSPRFAAYFLDSLRLERFDTGAANPTLNRNIVHAETIGYPTVGEQERIAEFLAAVDTKIAVEDDRLTALQALFKSMLHQVMTGQIRLLSDEGLPVQP